MAISIKNELGDIVINENVIAMVAGNAVHKCPGIAGPAGTALWGKENLGKGIKVTTDNNKIIVDIGIVIDLGVKITQLAESIMSAVKKDVMDVVGQEVEKVNVMVEGIKVEKEK